MAVDASGCIFIRSVYSGRGVGAGRCRRRCAEIRSTARKLGPIRQGLSVLGDLGYTLAFVLERDL